MEKLYPLLNPFSGIIKHLMVPIGQIRYYKTYRRFRKVNNPELFHEKIFWIMRHGDLTEWARLADKYLVREYVKEKCGDNILTKLYGVYDSAHDIDFDKLPSSFVMKTNNGCASNCFVRDKASTDLESIRKKMDFWMGIHYGELSLQPHYSMIDPKIIAEEYLIDESNPESSIIDYKFDCFDGFVLSCGIMKDRVPGTHKLTLMQYDKDWNPHPEWLVEGVYKFSETARPECLEQMIDIASTLSRGFQFVRVDLYCVNGKPYFGEMTFAPGLGVYNEKYQKIMGDMIDLSKIKLK